MGAGGNLRKETRCPSKSLPRSLVLRFSAQPSWRQKPTLGLEVAEVVLARAVPIWARRVAVRIVVPPSEVVRIGVPLSAAVRIVA